MWTDNLYQRLLEIKVNNDNSNGVAAEILNNEFGTKLTANAVTKKLKRSNYVYKKVESPGLDNNASNDSIKQNIKFNDDETIKHVDLNVKLTFKSKTDKTPEDIMRLKGYDPTEWKLLDVTDNDWSMTNGEGEQYWNYQCKIRMAPKKNGIDFEKLIAKVAEARKPVDVKYRDNKLTELDKCYLAIPVADAHFGYNSFDDYIDSLFKTLAVIKSRKWKKIVVINVGDSLHVNDLNMRTANDTQQETINFEKAVDWALDYFESVLTCAAEYAEKVEFIGAVGNHDSSSGYMLNRILERAFISVSNVSFDINLNHRKATLLGKNFIATMHGDKGVKRILETFPSEFSLLWAQSTNKELFTGHLHNEEVKSWGALKQRQVPTRAKIDKWHNDNGYTQAKKNFMLVEYSEYETEVVRYV